MFKLIKNDRIVIDEWKTLKFARGDTPHNIKLPVGPLLVPLSVWHARRAELIHREYEHGWPLGIWLSAAEQAESIAQDIDDFTVIAIEFDRHTESQGYATARQLRERYGYRSELRAIVPEDDASHLHAAEFDARIVTGHRKSNAEVAPPDRFNLNLIRQAKNILYAGAA